MLVCQLCEMTFNGVKPLEQHIQSKKHLKKQAENNEQSIHQNKVEEQHDDKSAVINQETEKTPSEYDEMLECKLCELTFNGVKPLEQHIQSKKHLNKQAENNQQHIQINKVEAQQDDKPASINQEDEKAALENDELLKCKL